MTVETRLTGTAMPSAGRFVYGIHVKCAQKIRQEAVFENECVLTQLLSDTDLTPHSCLLFKSGLGIHIFRKSLKQSLTLLSNRHKSIIPRATDAGSCPVKNDLRAEDGQGCNVTQVRVSRVL